jgi:hypothetical protein
MRTARRKVDREAARGRLVNVEFEMLRENYAHGYVLCHGPGASVEVIDKNTNASCKLFLHDLGGEPDQELAKMIDIAGETLDAVVKCRVQKAE